VLRTAVAYALPAALIAAGWLRLEHAGQGAEAIGLVVLALAPALVQPWWARLLAAMVVSFVAIRLTFGLSILDARPRDEEREFFGPFAAAFWTGAEQYFQHAQPFHPAELPLMHSVLLLSVFGFCLALGLAIAARRPLVAALVLVAGAAWPATLVAGADLLYGALLLAAVLILLMLAAPTAPRLYRPAVLAAAALLLAGVAAGAQPAVAKSEFLDWKAWDLRDPPQEPVGVRYVWEANYDGIEFPEERTTVLTIDGPQRPLYWRASTLDNFAGHRWMEDRRVLRRTVRPADLTDDAFLPERALNPRNWLRADVTVRALRDDRLVGPNTPVRFEPADMGLVEYRPGGVARVQDGLRQGQTYRVFGFAPQPEPEELAVAGTARTRNGATPLARYRHIVRGVAVPPFGAPGREERLEELFRIQPRARSLAPYRELYREVRRIVGDAPNPYAATLALEAWFRSSGEFTYDERLPVAPPERPPLLHFAMDTKRGYCQHFAGTMALMLRYLGIPARVAAGFTSGTYDEKAGRWTITNHDAHAWVEVWFENWGWIPFDPTPARAELAGPYSSHNMPLPQLADYMRGTGAAAAALGGGGDRRIGIDGNPYFGELPGAVGAASTSVVPERGASLLRLLAFLALAGFVTVAGSKTALRRGRYLTRDPRRLAGACRNELVDIMLDQGVPVSRGATLAELAELAQSRLLIDADRFATAAARARFAPPDAAMPAAREARRELQALRRRLRRRLRPARRFRGLVSLRSLGVRA
jgi:protein-glutamine gamma-glutamyltransferase